MIGGAAGCALGAGVSATSSIQAVPWMRLPKSSLGLRLTQTRTWREHPGRGPRDADFGPRLRAVDFGGFDGGTVRILGPSSRKRTP